MLENGKEQFILTKSYELAYALFRLADQMQGRDFGEQLRASGTGLLVATAGEDYASSARALHVMECLIKFGGDAGVIGTSNSDIILREIYALDAAITERKSSGKNDQVDVAEIFSKPEKAFNSAIRQTATPTASQNPSPIVSRIMPVEDFAEIQEQSRIISKMDEVHEQEVGNEKISEGGSTNINGILKSAIRQTAILERIRQSGNCRLKDIQEILPEASERTIRYDLQTLLEQDLIERIGNAGPSVFYRARQGAVG